VLLSLGQGHRLKRLAATRIQIQEKLANARAESEAKSAFLAKMSHELRTPMNAVLGIVELLQDTPLNPSQREQLQVVTIAGMSLLTVINDVLDHTQLKAEKVTLHPEPFNLDELLSQCYTMFRLGRNKPEICLEYVIEENTPHIIEADATRIRQVVVNLMGNALKFTHQGRVVLRVSDISATAGRNMIQIEVIDTGIGISEEQMEQLFHPFSQADSSTSRKYGGTGLGLTISLQLVECMGGNLHVESTPGKGSRFFFCFPYNKATPLSEDLTITKKALPATRFPDFSTLRVLVAEDNPVNRKVVGGFLKRLNIRPAFAENGEEVLDFFEHAHKPWDLVLMDCEMPLMDGYNATIALRRLEKSRHQAPVRVVALSAHALPEHRQKARNCGMDDAYLTKPLVFSEMVACINKYFQESPRQAADNHLDN